MPKWESLHRIKKTKGIIKNDANINVLTGVSYKFALLFLTTVKGLTD